MDLGLVAFALIAPAVIVFFMLWIDEMAGRRVGLLVLLAGALVQAKDAQVSLLLLVTLITLALYLAALAWLKLRKSR